MCIACRIHIFSLSRGETRQQQHSQTACSSLHRGSRGQREGQLQGGGTVALTDSAAAAAAPTLCVPVRRVDSVFGLNHLTVEPTKGNEQQGAAVVAS